MRRVYVGLDVGSNHCHLGALGEDGDAIAYRKFPTSEQTLVEEMQKIEGQVQVHHYRATPFELLNPTPLLPTPVPLQAPHLPETRQ